MREGNPSFLSGEEKIVDLMHFLAPRKTLFLRVFFAAIAILCTVRTAGAASLLDAGSIDFTIMSPDGRITLGHGRYTIDQEKDAIILHGESRYTTGEYDIETDVMSPGFSGSLPTLRKFDHLFYTPEGSVTRAAHADIAGGLASCSDVPAHIEKAEVMDFPPDTWAGATILLPIQQFLQAGGEGSLAMHVFNCTSKPGLYSVSISVASRPTGWPYSAAGAVQVNVRPHFGWFDMLIAPFVPKLNAWFDPGTGWGFEGVAIARYYRGPQVLIVRSDDKSNQQMQVLVPTATPTPSAGASQTTP